VLLISVILTAIITVVFAPALLYSNSVWMDDGTYSHGFLSIAIIGYTLLKSKAGSFVLRSKISDGWMLGFLACLTIGGIANWLEFELVHRSVFIVSIMCLAFTVTENKSHKYFFVPLFLFALASPIWGLSIPALQ